MIGVQKTSKTTFKEIFKVVTDVICHTKNERSSAVQCWIPYCMLGSKLHILVNETGNLIISMCRNKSNSSVLFWTQPVSFFRACVIASSATHSVGPWPVVLSVAGCPCWLRPLQSSAGCRWWLTAYPRQQAETQAEAQRTVLADCSVDHPGCHPIHWTRQKQTKGKHIIQLFINIGIFVEIMKRLSAVCNVTR